MAEIFVCKPGAISAEDRTALREAGVVVVELDNPADFRMVRAQPELNAGDILTAALAGLSPESDGASSSASRNRSEFVRLLARAALLRNNVPTPEPKGDQP